MLKTLSYKKIPHLTLTTLLPPYPDYAYFEGHKIFPFDPHSTAFSLPNAWWLAEASTLVYAEPDVVLPLFEKVGLKDVSFFETGSTQCFVAANNLFAIVSFRGTEVSEHKGRIDFQAMAADFITDADLWMSDWDNGGKAHRGFKKALDDIWKDLYASLESIRSRGCTIWMTGHSLGAALATLAGDRYEKTQAVYTFGSPRVGNAVFKEKYKTPCYRIVHNRDIVARVPPPIFYRHVGEIQFIDGHGKIHPQMEGSGKAEHFSQDDLNGHKDLAGSNENSVSGPIPDAIRDHVPLFYAVLLWNNLVAGENSSAKDDEDRRPMV